MHEIRALSGWPTITTRIQERAGEHTYVKADAIIGGSYASLTMGCTAGIPSIEQHSTALLHLLRAFRIHGDVVGAYEDLGTDRMDRMVWMVVDDPTAPAAPEEDTSGRE